MSKIPKPQPLVSGNTCWIPPCSTKTKEFCAKTKDLKKSVDIEVKETKLPKTVLEINKGENIDPPFHSVEAPSKIKPTKLRSIQSRKKTTPVVTEAPSGLALATLRWKKQH